MINKQKSDKIRTNVNNYFSELTENEKFSGAILISINGEKVVSQGYGMLNYNWMFLIHLKQSSVLVL